MSIGGKELIIKMRHKQGWKRPQVAKQKKIYAYQQSNSNLKVRQKRARICKKNAEISYKI